jgi:hypothetical protein
MSYIPDYYPTPTKESEGSALVVGFGHDNHISKHPWYQNIVYVLQEACPHLTITKCDSVDARVFFNREYNTEKRYNVVLLLPSSDSNEKNVTTDDSDSDSDESETEEFDVIDLKSEEEKYTIDNFHFAREYTCEPYATVAILDYNRDYYKSLFNGAPFSTEAKLTHGQRLGWRAHRANYLDSKQDPLLPNYQRPSMLVSEPKIELYHPCATDFHGKVIKPIHPQYVSRNLFFCAHRVKMDSCVCHSNTVKHNCQDYNEHPKYKEYLRQRKKEMKLERKRLKEEEENESCLQSFWKELWRPSSTGIGHSSLSTILLLHSLSKIGSSKCTC